MSPKLPIREAVYQFLVQQGVVASSVLRREFDRFADMLLMSEKSSVAESVPADMMQVFTDQQWPLLLFEFQSGMFLFSSKFDVPELHRQIASNGISVLPEEQQLSHWLIFKDQQGQVVRAMSPIEFKALYGLLQGSSFAETATRLWSDRNPQQAHHELTEMLLQWLAEGLVIDAGVPLPPDARFEQTQ